MNFALVGDDPEALELVSAIADSAGQTLARGAFLGDLHEQVVSRSPGIRVCGDWEELLGGGPLDGMIVAGNRPEVLEAARRLAAEGVPLLVLPHAALDAAFAYEVSLIQHDTQGILMPAFPHRFQDEIVRFRELAAALPGTVRLECERTLAGEDGGLVTDAQFDELWFQDADLIRYIAGRYNQVTALRFGSREGGASQQTVTLAGPGLPAAVWTAKCGRHAGLRITAAGEGQRVELRTGTDGVRLVRDVDETEENMPVAGESIASGRLSAFVEAIEGREAGVAWSALTRAFEMVEAAQRSIRRRRTIDLHYGMTSERTQFKTQMAAFGCGILAYTLLGLIAYLLLGQVVENKFVMKVFRIAWMVPALLFLLLQGLLLVARPASPDE